MPKVIHLEKVRKKISNERTNRYNAYTAYVHFLYQKKYKIDSELSDLYKSYLGELKTWVEFKESLPKLKSELLHFIEFSESKEEVKKIDTSYDDLYAYQKKREAEREAQLEKEREKLKKKEIKFNFTTPKKDWSIYGGWVNPFEPINKGRLGSTQEWRIEKPKRHYY